MAETTAEQFQNSDRLIDVMGFWPSFHDAHVKQAMRYGETCRVVVHVFDITTNEIDTRGYFILTKNHLVTIQASGILECTLPEEYDGDILAELSAKRTNGSIRVEFDSVIDPSRSWHVLCQATEILSVEPCDEGGRPSSTPPA